MWHIPCSYTKHTRCLVVLCQLFEERHSQRGSKQSTPIWYSNSGRDLIQVSEFLYYQNVKRLLYCKEKRKGKREKERTFYMQL